MTIWSVEIRELEKLLGKVSANIPALYKELDPLIGTEDANVAMLYARRCLEVIVTDLCECELKRPRKTEPLKGIIDKLNSEEKVPPHIITSMHGLNSLSVFGAHPKDFDPEQVKPALSNLSVIIKWYLGYVNSGATTDSDKGKIKSQITPGQPAGKFTTRQKKKLTRVLLFILPVIAAIFLYPKLFPKDPLGIMGSSESRLTVNVMPFLNMTSDSTWDDWQDGIQNIIITALSTRSEGLQVRQPESISSILRGNGIINYAAITPSLTSGLAKKMDADIFINGAMTQSGPTIRINAQLTHTKTGEVIRSFPINGTKETILYVIDTLSARIKDFLIISKMVGETDRKDAPRALLTTNSPEAYRNYILGCNSFFNMDFPTSIKSLGAAMAIDSNFVAANVLLSCAYMNLGLFPQAKNSCLIAYERRDLLPQFQKIYLDWIYSLCFDTIFKATIYVNQLIGFDDQAPGLYYLLGNGYVNIMQYDNAIPPLEKALDIYDKWGIKPLWAPNYFFLAIAYHNTGQYRKEKKLLKKAETDFPDEPLIIVHQAILAFSEGDTIRENLYVKKYIQICNDRLYPEANIMAELANYYRINGVPRKAVEYYRKALSLDPGNPVRMNNLAYSLINYNINIDEGMELVEKALKIRPDQFGSLHFKGLGLYKTGNFEEALKLMQRGWDLRMQKSIYNHEIFLQLEEVKKAVASQHSTKT